MLGALYVISSSNHKLQGRIIHILEGRKPGTEKLSDLLTQMAKLTLNPGSVYLQSLPFSLL